MIRKTESLPRTGSERPSLPVPTEAPDSMLRANILRAVKRAKELLGNSNTISLQEPLSPKEKISKMRYELLTARVGSKVRALIFALNLYGGGEMLSDITANRGFDPRDMMEAIEGSMNNPDRKRRRKNPSKKEKKQSS